MRTTIRFYACAAVVVLACSTLAAQEKQLGQSYERVVQQRVEEELTYVSEAKDKYEYWEKNSQLPRINGVTVNLNPAKTYDTPYLSMVHGESKAIITYPGYKELTLNFNRSEEE